MNFDRLISQFSETEKLEAGIALSISELSASLYNYIEYACKFKEFDDEFFHTVQSIGNPKQASLIIS